MLSRTLLEGSPGQKRRDGIGFEITQIFEYNSFMRRCSRCKEIKPLTEFNFKYKKRGIRQYHCRTCTRFLIQTHYRNHKEYYLKKARKRNLITRQQIHKYIWAYLSNHACVDCGEKDPMVLEFDHISQKNDSISNMVKYDSLERVKAEILLCEVRCANCHRRITAKRRSWNKQGLPL